MQAYNPVSEYYKARFGKKVRTIPVSIASDCPNRKGLKGMKTCTFCDVWGSAAYPEDRELSLQKQISEKMNLLGEKYNTYAFLVYFQAYTSTFLGLKKLRDSFNSALEFKEVKGLVIGTRPDCLSKSVLDTWNEYHDKSYVSVELGVQSFFEDQLLFMRRGHTAKSSIDAIHKIKKETNVDLSIHLIFGLPGETDQDIIQTARVVSSLPVDQVKLHNLHVLKNTELERIYNAGEFSPIDLATYAHRTILFLQHLDPRIYVQRLVALSSRWDELIAPQWTKEKMGSYQYILDRMSETRAYQGQFITDQGLARL